MSRPIPEVRDELHALAVENDMPVLAKLAEDLRRRKCSRTKAAPRQKPITRDTCAAVRVFKKKNPAMSLSKIAQHFGIDGSGGGRVHEILYGFADGSTYEEKHNL
jgi:hypothetical protein